MPQKNLEVFYGQVLNNFSVFQKFEAQIFVTIYSQKYFLELTWQKISRQNQPQFSFIFAEDLERCRG
jgi:hypothetical protein